MTARAPFPIPLLPRLIEPFYRFGLAQRNRAFDAGKNVTRLAVPVISVGNISVGGTGKTPMVMRIVKLLREAGAKPVIAMRGYRARPGQPSDEEAEYRDRFSSIPIVAQPDRLAGLAPIIERGEANIVVLDDGFQHRQIARDLDLVLLDASRSPHTDRCLPAGWLREPVESLARAHAVIITHAEAAPEGEVDRARACIVRHAPGALRCVARHAWTSLLRHEGDASEQHAIEHLRGRRVVVALAIGNPAPFVASAERAGALIERTMIRRDHHAWTAPEFALRPREPHALLTSHKDWVKLRTLRLHDRVPVIVPTLEHVFDEGEPELVSSIHALARANE